MSVNSQYFVEWKEEFVSQERGNRVVHYFLKDSNGESTLAVVGTERSVRHMFYVVAEEFVRVYGAENSIHTGYKWRSRREVVDWLTSMLSKQHLQGDHSKSPKHESAQASGSPEYPKNGGRLRNVNGRNSDIVWSGNAWTCGKQLKHYPTFCRNGTTIAIQSFVFVMANGENHYVAYLEDMYEDKKGQKKVKVRWFHHCQEVKGAVSLRNPHPKEIFITAHAQVISAECVDGPATVLTREHFEKCLPALPNSLLARIHFCSRQFRSNRLKPFNLSKLHGYYDQPLISLLNSSPFWETDMEESELAPGENVKLGTKRTSRGRGSQIADNLGVGSGRGYNMMRYEPSCKNLKYGLSGLRLVSLKQIECQPWSSPVYKVDEKIELLCQDSSIRGCWFRCVVLQVSRKHIKVQYDDLLDDDGYGNLEEWVPVYKVALPDKLGMRCSDRPTIRPSPSNDLAALSLDIGAAVDAWWSDGWWEGVVTGFDSGSDDYLQVYLPGESFFLNMHKKDIRISKDWVGNQWVDIGAKPDVLSAISAVINPENKNSLSSTVAKDVKPDGLDVLYTDVPNSTKLDISEEEKPKLGTLATCDNLQDMDPFNEEKPASQEQVKGEGGDELHSVRCNDEKDHNETEEDSDDSGSRSDADDFETSERNCKITELVDVPA
ncbi:uncharacterized protein LOC123202161 isoform X2 [Mangifera indica]|uniref:uncharacterized protein LOC123202161 isoform X2 n=1 Tax=Mangifera indica TaxID=29780 RepID=UPI001CF9C645|nr:uncharacterized protein LOC123202161 isoform X2 [Mangifera indica]